jgi:Nucleotide modification associated domain 3
VKIIFSRKGFDAENGGVPSPIFSDGRMLSLPIPRKSQLSYGEIRSPRPEFRHLGELVEHLTGYRMSEHSRAHLDPDLDSFSISRANGWRGIFGQSGRAQRELEGNGVDKGDLFLFFGQFCGVDFKRNRQLRYVNRATATQQVIFGWPRIGRIHHLPDDTPQIPHWAEYHAHLKFSGIEPIPNVLYVADEKLDVSSDIPGWGTFQTFSDGLRLTSPVALPDKKGKLRLRPSRWQLPAWMNPWREPVKPRQPLTYHCSSDLWKGSGEEFAVLQTQAPGQEFVLDADAYPEAWPSAKNLIETFSRNTTTTAHGTAAGQC